MRNPCEFLPKQSIRTLVIPAILGAASPLSLLLFLILSQEEHFESWMAIPLLLIPAGGALGGIFFFLMGFVWYPRGNKKLLAVILSISIYFVALWLSAVLAFSISGHWD
jgi:hypothetical protein